jgi:hypothetical protein
VIAGYRMASGQHRSWLHILGFTVLTVIIVYVVLDIEYPRARLIRLESADQLLVNLRDSMKRQVLAYGRGAPSFKAGGAP